MNNNHIKLTKYGLVGICMALIGFMGFMLKSHQETVRQFNETLKNQVQISTEARVASTQVQQQLVDVVGEVGKATDRNTDVVREVGDYLKYLNGVK